MGKGKKKFLKDGDKGQHFYLVHRSQRDEAYGNEENPSEFVLVPSSLVSQSFLFNKDYSM